MKTLAIIQARMGSTRLPGKVLMPILEKPMLWHIVRRVRAARGINDVIVATSNQTSDAPIRQFCTSNGIRVVAGSETDVLDRYYQAALMYSGDRIVRVTADCPLIDPNLIEQLLDYYKSGGYDHAGLATGAGAAHISGGRFPNGLDVECFSVAALRRAWREATMPSDREHVTPYIWRIPDRFSVGMLKSLIDYSDYRWTVDHQADFELVTRIYEALYTDDRIFLMADILDYLAQHPELMQSNQRFIGKEGYARIWNETDLAA